MKETIVKQILEKVQLYERASHVSNDGIFEWDLENNFIKFDATYYSMAGYKVDEFPSSFEEWSKRVHPDDFARLEGIVNDFIAGEIDQYDQEFRFLKKSGDWMWIRAKIKLITRNRSGIAVNMIGTHTDITDRKLIEQELIDYKKTIEDQSEDKIKQHIALLEHKISDRSKQLSEVIQLLDDKNASLLQLVECYTKEKIKDREIFFDKICNIILPPLEFLKTKYPSESNFIETTYANLNAIMEGIDPSGENTEKLSRREKQIYQLLKLNKTSKEISQELFLSPATIERHRHNIRFKLGLVKKKHTAK